MCALTASVFSLLVDFSRSQCPLEARILLKGVQHLLLRRWSSNTTLRHATPVHIHGNPKLAIATEAIIVREISISMMMHCRSSCGIAEALEPRTALCIARHEHEIAPYALV